ncbi:phage shock protein operon transcriptional activator [Balneatrix alpica]|uniref:Phage shock protein operon transcriptional activator n=1 Tax=Balneatrix alpica TaxID=75684 RepID=A0ABV5ZAF7_9GAMM|nr:phage shock protein operon transcriptional activator [Balneatrix alpica]
MEASRQPIIGSSEALHQVLQHASQLAPLNRPVLLLGERGTGKELLAQRLHYLSERWQQPFLQINCATLSDSLLESELFGHEQGAFTGASRSRAGLFERADGGTLFLDELATASLAVQEKLLRVIEYGQFSRLGGNRTLQVDVRVVAATHADLPGLAASGRFRADLLDRLAFDVLNLPPLRVRRDDILELAEHFAQRMCLELGQSWFAGFSEAAAQALVSYPWPGNVRELKNVVERSLYLQVSGGQGEARIEQVVFDPFASPWQTLATADATPSAEVSVSSQQAAPAATMPPHDLKAALAEQEQRWIAQALALCRYNQRETASYLGLSYHQLRAALRKYPQLLELG